MVALKKLGSACALAGFVAIHRLASAQQVTVSYAGSSTAVPTASAWGMIILSLSLALLAVVAMKRRGSGKPVLGLALAALVSLGAGSYAIKDALAAAISALSMTNPAGGVVTASQGSTPAPVTNQTSVPLRIVSITPIAAMDPNPSGCKPGSTVVMPGTSCTILAGAGVGDGSGDGDPGTSGPDTTPPAFADSLTVKGVTTTSVQLGWSAATDNVGVKSYVLKRNGAIIATLTPGTLSYSDSGLTSNSAYNYSLQAADAAGNKSSEVSLTVRTLADGETVLSAPLPLYEQPFGELDLVDEIDTATTVPAQQIPANVSSVSTVMAKSARVMSPGETARFMTYRLGAGKGLVAKQAYVLDIEYPDDVSRAMFVANRGADFVRGFATGKAIGDARRSYTEGTLESLAYPQSGNWKNYRSLFYLHERFSPPTAQRNAECAKRDLLPADGFDVTVFQTNQYNDPRNNGVAIGKIRLYKVRNSSSLSAAINYPGSLPRRHVYWREEMADEAVMASTSAKRAVANPIDWFAFKMDMGRALGFNTVGKDMMEWGHNQGFNAGDPVWMNNAQGLMVNIWAQIVAQAAARDLYVMPYLEYGGSLGSNCSPGNPCDKTPGNYKSLGFQRRTQKLFHGELSGDGEATKDRYTGHWWTEGHSADLTDPDTLTDLKKVVDKLLVTYKGQAKFQGLWLRMRQTKLPMSFSAETIARYNADNPANTRTLVQLRTTESSRAAYYTWWYGKRRAFLIAIRDYARAQMGDSNLQVHFTPYADEPVPRAYTPDPIVGVTDPLDLVTDDPAWWSSYANNLAVTGDNEWFKWQWKGTLPAVALSQRIHSNGLRFFRKPYQLWANGWPELGHSTPPADPQNYQSDSGLAMTLSFGNGLYTVDDAALLNEYNNSAGASLVHHFPLNEDDGNGFENNTCTTLRPIKLSDAFDAKFGYLSVAVERSEWYSTLAEARALANGNPINIGYLEPSSMSRGFPAYVRRFNQALLSLPALPMTTVTGISSNSQVVVRRINSASGTYYAVINPTMQRQSALTLTFAGASTVRDLLKQADYASAKLLIDLYPGEVRTFLVP